MRFWRVIVLLVVIMVLVEAKGGRKKRKNRMKVKAKGHVPRNVNKGKGKVSCMPSVIFVTFCTVVEFSFFASSLVKSKKSCIF